MDKNEMTRGPAIDISDEKSDYLIGHRSDPLALTGGLIGVVSLAVLVVAAPAIAARFSQADTPPAETKPFEYIEARLLRLGEIKDKEKLPDREVPALPTIPEEVLPLDREENKPSKPEEKKEEKQPDAVEDDKLRKVFDKARAFAEIQDDYKPEGRSDGVEDGDVSDPALASIGDTYGRALRKIIAERWEIPTLISDDERKKLRAEVLIRIDADLTIAEVKVLKGGSKNALFDDSLIQAIERVRTEVRTLPAPPEAIAPNVFGGGIVLKFSGRDAPAE